MKRVCFLMERGTPPRLNPIMADAFELLDARGIQVSVCFPEHELLRLGGLGPSLEADVYVLKSDTELSLSLAMSLERLGARVLNRAAASLRAKDKILAAATLARAGLPAPRSVAAAEPAQLTEHLGPLILKPHRGYHGAGVAVATSPEELPGRDAYPEVVLAQDYLARARLDLKVFVIGDEVFGVRKAFAGDSFLRAGEPTTLTPEVEDIARRCGHAFGLELYGLDIAEDPERGLQIIDVNYFPGYRGVPDAARKIADHITRVVRDVA
jgi:ribosomal protein S6--L-glutamate ligase